MKGRAIIELTDANGVSERIENNLVTNFFNDYLRIIANLQTTGSGANLAFLRMDDVARRYDGLKLNNAKSYGIKLYGSHNEENASKYYICQNHIGYGTDANTFTETRGIFNEPSSVPILDNNDNVIGQRLVWDFPTNCANGTIHSISLTKNNNIPSSQGINHFMKSTGILSGLFGNVGAKNSLTFTRDGKIINVSGGKKIRIHENSGCLITRDGWQEDNNNYIEINLTETHRNLFKVYDFGEVYKTVGKNNISDLYELLEIKKSDHSVKSVTPLPNCDVDDCKDMSFCGTNYIVFSKMKPGTSNDIYNTEFGGYIPAYTAYDMRKQQMKSIPVKTYENYAYSGTNNMMCVENDHGSTEVVANYSRNYGSYYFRTCVIYETEFGDLEIKNIYESNKQASYAHVSNFGTLPIILYSDLSDYSSNTANSLRTCTFRGYISTDQSAVLTINNLSAPIHKTEANTMKITYELRWG